MVHSAQGLLKLGVALGLTARLRDEAIKKLHLDTTRHTQNPSKHMPVYTISCSSHRVDSRVHFLKILAVSELCTQDPKSPQSSETAWVRVLPRIL